MINFGLSTFYLRVQIFRKEKKADKIREMHDQDYRQTLCQEVICSSLPVFVMSQVVCENCLSRTNVVA